MIFWIMPDNGVHTQDVMESFLAPFKKENPAVPINIRVINRRTLWGRIFTLKQAVSGEEQPDLLAFPNYWTQLLAQTGMIENLTGLDKTLRVDCCLDILKPHAYKQGGADIYSMPWWFDVSALHYREDHLKQISANPGELLSTWPGLLEACRLLKEHFKDIEGYFPVQNSDWRGTLSNRGALPCLFSRGARVISEDGKASDIREAAFEHGLEDYLELALKNYMPVLRERSSKGNIVSGRSSISITRRQGTGILESGTTGSGVQTISVPRSGANYVNYLSGINLAIVKTGRDGQNALKLLKWITRPENQLKYAAASEVFPANESSLESLLLSSPQRIKSYSRIIAQSATLPNRTASGALMEVLAELLDAASAAVVKHSYNKNLLKAGIKKAAVEIDNILRLYGG